MRRYIMEKMNIEDIQDVGVECIVPERKRVCRTNKIDSSLLFFFLLLVVLFM